MIRRRGFLAALAGGAAALAVVGKEGAQAAKEVGGVVLPASSPEEDVFAYVTRVQGAFDLGFYKQLLGASNPFKEGDRIVGVAAAGEASRRTARALLANTRLQDLDAHPLLDDQLSTLLRQSVDAATASRTASWTLAELKRFLLSEPEETIKTVTGGLSSVVIGCLVKLMNDRELIAVGGKLFNPLPGSRIGAKGYLGARIQPNSPTDNVEDIRWQVLDGWAYAVGDVLLGANPVSSEAASVLEVELALQDLLVTFDVDDNLPHCVLAHIDVQSEVEQRWPASTALWFQSIAGSDAANTTFDISVQKMLDYADRRNGRFGFYFETGQGADFTNGHSHGFDMVLHESRKYGFARALSQQVAKALRRTGAERQPWVHLNDVAGFIGPEVFRTREQLVRCCLEDIVMGKLHGLCLGLDVCSTLHMDVSLEDLDWCLDRIMPANPAYLMALPTKVDPMLGYLTTGFQDHVRIRERFGYRVEDRMWRFFQQLGVIDEGGRPTSHFGDPVWVYLQYRRRKGDTRSDEAIRAEGESQLAAVRGRGVFIARGHGAKPSQLAPQLQIELQRIYRDAKAGIWAELKPSFVKEIPHAVPLATLSKDRTDYILHPQTGERLSTGALLALQSLRRRHAGKYDVQIVVSDGLNALAIMDRGHLAPYLEALREHLQRDGRRVAPEHLVLTSGRVRAGYRIGEALLGDLEGPRAILHVIGERPGSGHHTFSIYISSPHGSVWGRAGVVDHNITKVVSGVAATALPPTQGAEHTVRLLRTLT